MTNQIALPVAQPRQNRRWIVAALGAVLLAVAGFVGYQLWPTAGVPADLDFSTTRVSSGGRYRVSYTASVNPVPINRLHAWTLHLETLDGRPVDGASIAVDGDMPQHGHGLPTQPVVSERLGDGNYLVEGMKFQMGGWWLMEFTVTVKGQPDKAEFNLLLEQG